MRGCDGPDRESRAEQPGCPAVEPKERTDSGTVAIKTGTAVACSPWSLEGSGGTDSEAVRHLARAMCLPHCFVCRLQMPAEPRRVEQRMRRLVGQYSLSKRSTEVGIPCKTQGDRFVFSHISGNRFSYTYRMQKAASHPRRKRLAGASDDGNTASKCVACCRVSIIGQCV